MWRREGRRQCYSVRRRRPQRDPGRHRRGGHGGQRRTRQQIAGPGSHGAAADRGIDGGDQDALPEKVKQRGSKQFYSIHFSPRFFLSRPSIMRQISANSPAATGSAPQEPLVGAWEVRRTGRARRKASAARVQRFKSYLNYNHLSRGHESLLGTVPGPKTSGSPTNPWEILEDPGGHGWG